MWKGDKHCVRTVQARSTVNLGIQQFPVHEGDVHKKHVPSTPISMSITSSKPVRTATPCMLGKADDKYLQIHD